MAGKLSQTPRRQVAGDVGVAAAVRKPRGKKRLLRTAQRGVGGDPVERAAGGVREVFQQQAVPLRQCARPLALSGSAGGFAARRGRALPSPASSASMRSRTVAVPRQ